MTCYVFSVGVKVFIWVYFISINTKKRLIAIRGPVGANVLWWCLLFSWAFCLSRDKSVCVCNDKVCHCTYVRNVHASTEILNCYEIFKTQSYHCAPGVFPHNLNLVGNIPLWVLSPLSRIHTHTHFSDALLRLSVLSRSKEGLQMNKPSCICVCYLLTFSRISLWFWLLW